MTVQLIKLLLVLSVIYSWFTMIDGSALRRVRDSSDLFPRIIGGSFAEPGEFPYYVQVTTQIGDLFPTCGGSLIDKQTILTAAHCVWDYGEAAKLVFVQTKSSQRFESPPISWEVQNGTQIIVHENYMIDDKGIPHNDIALIKLKHPIISNQVKDISFIRLASRKYCPGTLVEMAGLGFTENGRTPNSLKKKSTEIVSRPESPQDGIIYTQRDEEMAYIGDSGGPVVVKGITPDHDELIGIISFGDDYLEGNREGHTDVYHYLDWIKRNRQIIKSN